MDFATRTSPACLLVDNGSLEPAAVLSLRRIARQLAERLARPVEPVSLLHANRIAPETIGDRAAETLEPHLTHAYAAGQREFLVLPLFFGPSAALTDYIPKRVRALTRDRADLRVHIAAPLSGKSGEPDRRIARLLADFVRGTAAQFARAQPIVVLVDHGSPQENVARVRDEIAGQLRDELRGEVRSLVAASMERRPGPEFAFNEPLLERALEQLPCGADAGDVIVAQLFFSPGRHAGPGGDIERLCRAAEKQFAGMRVHRTPLVAEHPLLVEILADRYREALEAREGFSQEKAEK